MLFDHSSFSVQLLEMLSVKLFLLLLLCGIFWVLGQAESLPNNTQLKLPFERVFTRKRRALLFPPGSFLKFTCALGKGLLSTYPRGLTFNLEEAVYFPMPGTRADLYPKKFKPKTTTMKPKTTTPSAKVYMNDPRWRVKVPFPPKTHRIDMGAANYKNPFKWQQWAKYGAQQAERYEQRPWQAASKAKWSKWTTPSPKWSDWAWRETHSGRNYLKPDQTRHIQYFHGYRDRRQLFDHFSGLNSLLGVDVKSCIMRVICDSKRLLLPPGYSMLQDMLRVIFSMPTLNGRDDEYSRLLRMDSKACSLQLKSKCNINFLIWLLSGKYN